MTGHLLGAAGGHRVGHLREGDRDRAGDPPTMNLEDPDPDCDLDYVPNTAREAEGADRPQQQSRIRRPERLGRFSRRCEVRADRRPGDPGRLRAPPRPGRSGLAGSALEDRREVWAAWSSRWRAAHGTRPPIRLCAGQGLESNFDPRADKRAKPRAFCSSSPGPGGQLTSCPVRAAGLGWRRPTWRLASTGWPGRRPAWRRGASSRIRLLWACYQYGFENVAARDFEIEARFPRLPTRSPRVLVGQIHPIAPPK